MERRRATSAQRPGVVGMAWVRTRRGYQPPNHRWGCHPTIHEQGRSHSRGLLHTSKIWTLAHARDPLARPPTPTSEMKPWSRGSKYEADFRYTNVLWGAQTYAPHPRTECRRAAASKHKSADANTESSSVAGLWVSRCQRQGRKGGLWQKRSVVGMRSSAMSVVCVLESHGWTALDLPRLTARDPLFV